MEYHFTFFPFLCISFLFVFMVLKTGTRSKRSDPPNLPPGPWKMPFLGNIHNLIGTLPHRGLCELAKKHGPVMHLQLGELSTIVVSAPETAEAVMKTHDIIFSQRPRILAAHILTYESKDIAFSHGNYWRQLRKICINELLTSKRVKSFQSLRQKEVENVIKSISLSKGSPTNLTRRIFSLTYGVIARAAFGGKCKEQEAFIGCVEEMIRLVGAFGPADVFPSVKFLGVMSGIRPRKLHEECDDILESIIKEHETNAEHSAKGKGQVEDLVDVLLRLREDGDPEFPLTIDNIKAVILDIFIAGGETSSTIVDWAMSELIKNPRIMDKAQEEVRQVFRAQGHVDEAGIEKLTFSKSIIKETLRLHPSAPLLLPRECQEKCNIYGYDIPSKSKVIVNAWAIGRDPRYWQEPDRFYPERFLDSSVDFKGTNFAFVPFGAGRRVCPGISFALSTMELMLANLLYHFDWELPDGLKNEDLDMTEAFGGTVRRYREMILIPVPYDPR